MKHLKTLDYPGGLNKLAEDLGNLSYDSLATFLEKLADKINIDALADKDRKRIKLSKELESAATHIKKAWKICKPFMKSS